MAVHQSLAAGADVNRLNGANDDAVAVPLEDLFDRAIDNCERVLEAPGARGELAPSRAGQFTPATDRIRLSNRGPAWRTL